MEKYDKNPSQDKRRKALLPKDKSREVNLDRVKRQMILRSVKETYLSEYTTHAVCRGCNKGFPLSSAKRKADKSPVCPKCGSDRVVAKKRKKVESRSLTILNRLFEGEGQYGQLSQYADRENSVEEYKHGYEVGYSSAKEDYEMQGDAHSLPKVSGSKDYVEGFRVGWREFWYNVSES